MIIEYVAHAAPSKHGWQLHVEGVGDTEVLSLETAERQVRDMIEIAGVIASDVVTIRIVLE